MTTPKNRPALRQTCGTYAGYQAHRKANELVCDDCRDARNEWERNRRAARTTASSRAQLSNAERAALLDVIANDGGPATPWQHTTIAVVEAIITERLLRYT